MTGPSAPRYEHLGPFSDLVAAAKAVRPLFGRAPVPGDDARLKAKESLRFAIGDEQPLDIRIDRAWTAEGVRGEEISWSVGFGPRTQAVLLKPARGSGQLPGIVALHDHGHFKFFGKEKIADGPERLPRVARGVPEDLLWRSRLRQSSRKVGFCRTGARHSSLGKPQVPPGDLCRIVSRALAEAVGATLEQEYAEPEIVRYNGAAYLHEHVVSKYCTVLGTSLAAVIAYEDRVAAAQRPPNASRMSSPRKSDASVFREEAFRPRCCVRHPISSPPALSWE